MGKMISFQKCKSYIKMDYNSKIRIIEGAIAQINANIGHSGNLRQRGEALKHFALIALDKIGSSEIILSAIKEIDFPLEDLPFAGLYNTQDIREENKRVAYRQSVKALIGILEQERERLVKEQQEEAQRKSAKIQLLALISSVVAAACAVATLLLMIFD